MKNLLLLAIGVAALSANPVYAQKYPIRISSRDEVGQKYSITASTNDLRQLTATQAGRALGTQAAQYQVSFEGRAEVLAVDTKDKAYRIAYTVNKFTRTERGMTTEILKPGTVILTDGSQEKDKQIVVKNGTIDDSAREAASSVLSTHRPNSVGDDEVFGTSEPKGIGDKWPINSEAAAEDLKRSESITAGTLAGTVQLVSKGTVDGTECLNLLAELNGDGIAMSNAPPGFVPDTGTMRVTFRGCVPTNPSAISRKEEAEMNGRFRVTGSAGTPNEGVVLEVTLSRKTETLITQDR